MTLPTLTALLDDGSGTFPLNISSRVLSTNGYEITRGRDDWQGGVTAGGLTLTLNNSDGFFSNSGSGWDVDGWDTGPWGGAPLMSIDQQIRLQETINGVTYTRFTGFVKAMPVAWPATVLTFSTVQPSATDVQARLERWTLRSMLEEEILVRSPTSYYTLGEPAGSTSAGDTSDNQAPPMTQTGTGAGVTFGQGTGPTDGLTTATFSAGKFLASTATVPAGHTQLIAFSRPSAPASVEIIAAANNEYLMIETTGQVSISHPGLFGIGRTAVITTAANLCDGGVHLVGWSTNAGVGYTLLADGASTVAADFLAGTFAPAPLTLGNQQSNPLLSVTTLTGDVSHAASFTRSLSAFDFGQIYTAATDPTETVHDRMQRFVAYTGAVITTVGLSGDMVTGQSTSGQTAWEAMQDVVATEGGVLFDNGFAALTFQGRAFAAGKTAPDLILSSQWATPDIQPVVDDQQLVNYFEVSAAGTGSTQIVRDTSSEGTHGRYPQSQTYLVRTDDEARQRGAWTVAKFAEPSPRYGTLTINLYKMTDAMASSVLDALEVNCWLRVTSLAGTQDPNGATADVMVEGWQEQVTAESWTITCNVVDRGLFTTLILDDPVFGALDSYPIGY